METIIRNVRDFNNNERQILERVLGQQLRENQQVIIQVVTLGIESPEHQEQTEAAPSPQLPEWCNVFAGLTEEEVAGVESVIRQRVNLTRSSE